MVNQPKPTSSPGTGAPKQLPLFNDMHAFVASRDRTYDDAWLKTAQVMKLLGIEKSEIWQTPYSFAWQMILNKLIRAMASPEHADHWKDMQGYAQLVLEDANKGK
jgi:hypothetical protein